MNLYKKWLVIGTTIMTGIILTGYLGSGASASVDDGSVASSRISYQKAKKENKHNKVYKLAFFESRTTYDDEHLYYTIGYYSHGKVAYKNVSTKLTSDQFVEVIQADLDTPYVYFQLTVKQ